MTLDSQISGDLAALGHATRQRILGVDRVRALAAPRVAVATTSNAPALALLAVAGVHARRAGRIASGATALAVGLLFAVGPWLCPIGWFDEVWWGHRGLGTFCASAAVLALAVRGVASALAARRFQRRMRHAADRGDDVMTCAHQLAARLDFPALALAIAGVAGFAIVIGKLCFLDGNFQLEQWFERGYFLDATLDQALVDTVTATVLVAIAAAVIATAIVRGRVALLHGAVVAGGLALGVATVCVGSRLDDVGTLGAIYVSHDIPSHPLRAALTAAGSLAVLLVVAGLAARQRRGELAQLGVDRSAT
jgi:hypothetical protein